MSKLYLIIGLFLIWWLFLKPTVEHAAGSPGTLVQLATSSTDYYNYSPYHFPRFHNPYYFHRPWQSYYRNIGGLRPYRNYDYHHRRQQPFDAFRSYWPYFVLLPFLGLVL